MKKNFTWLAKCMLVAIVLFAGTNLYAQVTVGSGDAASKAAILDIKSITATTDGGATTDANGGGVLLPRVVLNNLSEMTPFVVTTASEKLQHKGLMIYNLSTTNGFSEGVYVWNGTKWEKQAGDNSGTPTSVTASNGLTAVGSDIQLGGDLSKETTINTKGHEIHINSEFGAGSSSVWLNENTALYADGDIELMGRMKIGAPTTGGGSSGSTAGVGKVLTSDKDGYVTWTDMQSSASINADEGLTKNGNVIELGGKLTKDIVINQDDNTLMFDGTYDTDFKTRIYAYNDLVVKGTANLTKLKITSDKGTGKVLTSDASGNATWKDLPTATKVNYTGGIIINGTDVQLGGVLPSTVRINKNGQNFELTGTGENLFEGTTIVDGEANFTGKTTVNGEANFTGKTTVSSLRILGSPKAGYVLTSDANGNASWQPAPTSGGGGSSGGAGLRTIKGALSIPYAGTTTISVPAGRWAFFYSNTQGPFLQVQSTVSVSVMKDSEVYNAPTYVENYNKGHFYFFAHSAGTVTFNLDHGGASAQYVLIEY